MHQTKKSNLKPFFQNLNELLNVLDDNAPLSPGMKYLYYAPSKPFILLQRPETDPSFDTYLEDPVAFFTKQNIAPSFLFYKKAHRDNYSENSYLLGDDRFAAETGNNVDS